MEENNLQFRIWDNLHKKWVPNYTQLTKDAEIVLVDQKGGVWVFHNNASWNSPRCLQPHDAENKRFEVSQYIGRKDSKGVKAFTGDHIILPTVDVDKVCEIILFGLTYKAFDNYGESHYISGYEFTIIGNKWEGLLQQEPVQEKGASGDSTVQRESFNSQKHEDALRLIEAKKIIDVAQKFLLEILGIKIDRSGTLSVEKEDVKYFMENFFKPTLSENDFVPYQLCPKCFGEGETSNIGYSASIMRTCPICNGAKLIPMAKQNK